MTAPGPRTCTAAREQPNYGKDGRGTSNMEERAEIYKELQKQVYEDRSIYPLAFPNYVFAVRSYVKGADTIRTAPIFEDFSKLSIEK